MVMPAILRVQERQIWTFARGPHVKRVTQDWIKVKNPKAAVATRVIEGGF
jgi:hypothetical protein